MPKDAHISREQLLETAGREPLCIILAFAGIQMLLVYSVVVVAKFVHENVQQHERPRLRFRETTRDAFLQPVRRNPEPFEKSLMDIEIRRPEICPKVVAPRMQKNRPGFFSMVKLMRPVTAIDGTRQHDPLQTLGELIPPWNDVNEPLHVSLRDHMTKSAPR
jgi:hypothetical protein